MDGLRGLYLVNSLMSIMEPNGTDTIKIAMTVHLNSSLLLKGGPHTQVRKRKLPH